LVLIFYFPSKRNEGHGAMKKNQQAKGDDPNPVKKIKARGIAKIGGHADFSL
jgi:hypothetical protein